MPATLPEVERIVRKVLDKATVAQSLIFWWDRPFNEGDVVRVGPQELKAPFLSTLVFIDMAPKSNWSHPCKYMFISNLTDEVRAFDASFPPFMDKPPPEYSLILRYGVPPPDSKDYNPY